MPIEVLRDLLTNQELTPDFKASWRFLDELKAAPFRDFSAAHKESH